MQTIVMLRTGYAVPFMQCHLCYMLCVTYKLFMLCATYKIFILSVIMLDVIMLSVVSPHSVGCW
jgi:hypothetical protein